MVKFIVDSTFGLSKAYAAENDVKIVNLTVSLCGKEYVEGYREDWGAFYSEYARLKSAATTSQPSPRAFMDAIDGIFGSLETADADIIILTIGDRLSGAVSSAKIASLQYPTKRIAVVDTHCAATSAYLFLDEMIKAEKSGKGFDELIEYSQNLEKRISIEFIPATLVELARGGRVNKLLSKIGTILKIRPVFCFARNEVNVTGKYLGIKNAINAAVSMLPKKTDRVAVCYIGDDRHVDTLKDRLFKERGMSHLDVFPVSPVLGAHIGVGTVGIAYMASRA